MTLSQRHAEDRRLEKGQGGLPYVHHRGLVARVALLARFVLQGRLIGGRNNSDRIARFSYLTAKQNGPGAGLDCAGTVPLLERPVSERRIIVWGNVATRCEKHRMDAMFPNLSETVP